MYDACSILRKLMINSKESYEKYWQEKRSETSVEYCKKSFPNEILESLETVLRNGKRLLDVGCGDGSLIEIAGSRFDEVYGCDISETVLKTAKNKGMITAMIARTLIKLTGPIFISTRTTRL